MATTTLIGFSCRACGAGHPKWQGRCGECGEWDSLVESRRSATRRRRGRADGAVPLTEVSLAPRPRRATGIAELDRVLGGGLVTGSAVLLAGDPGIGKSTLTLQASAGLASAGATVLYVSGEESPSQVRLRAERLGISAPGIRLLAETEVGAVIDHARALSPDLLVVDSVQTLLSGETAGAAGSVSQIRDCAGLLTAFAKESDIPVLLIGHVTKTGDVAGPRVLSHVVDAVLSFEGDRYHRLRVLRAVKNRFGPADEVGIFEMREDGLAEMPGPAGLLLAEGAPAGPGRVVVPVLSGTRIFLLEIQALVTLTVAPPSRRRMTGLDGNRVDLLLAVLPREDGLSLAGRDVFVNAVGGVRAEEPGADLGAALAIASSLLDAPFPADTAVFGEVGLLGEVRPVARARARLAEAAKLGMSRALVPPGTDVPPGIRAKEVGRLSEALAYSSSVSKIRR